MLTLVLVRHAKSDWGDPTLADHNRPLNTRGAQNAPMMAERFARSSTSVDRIISSTALRTTRTAEAFAAALGLEMHFDANLYGSSADTLMTTATSSGVSAVMLVAHDPGITVLAERLSRGEISHMPTCAVATFRWDETDWNDAAYGNVSSWEFETPRSVERR